MATAYVERLLPTWRLFIWRGCPCGHSLRGEAIADVVIAYGGEAAHVATAYVERLLLTWRLLMWRGCPCGHSLRREAVADVAIAYVERLPMWRQLMWRGCC